MRRRGLSKEGNPMDDTRDGNRASRLERGRAFAKEAIYRDDNVETDVQY